MNAKKERSALRKYLVCAFLPIFAQDADFSRCPSVTRDTMRTHFSFRSIIEMHCSAATGINMIQRRSKQYPNKTFMQWWGPSQFSGIGARCDSLFFVVVVVCFFLLLFLCVLFICCVFVVAVAVMLLFGISRCCRWYALQMDRYCFVFIYFSIFCVSVRLLLAPGPPLLAPSIAEFLVLLYYFFLPSITNFYKWPSCVRRNWMGAVVYVKVAPKRGRLEQCHSILHWFRTVKIMYFYKLFDGEVNVWFGAARFNDDLTCAAEI